MSQVEGAMSQTEQEAEPIFVSEEPPCTQEVKLTDSPVQEGPDDDTSSSEQNDSQSSSHYHADPHPASVLGRPSDTETPFRYDTDQDTDSEDGSEVMRSEPKQEPPKEKGGKKVKAKAEGKGQKAPKAVANVAKKKGKTVTMPPNSRIRTDHYSIVNRACASGDHDRDDMAVHIDAYFQELVRTFMHNPKKKLHLNGYFSICATAGWTSDKPDRRTIMKKGEAVIDGPIKHKRLGCHTLQKFWEMVEWMEVDQSKKRKREATSTASGSNVPAS